MALAQGITLADARQSVITRLGQATGGNLPANSYALIDENLRSAQRQLYVEAFWLVNYRRTTITLVNGQSDYDWPDSTEPGRVGQIAAVRISDGKEFPLEAGIRSNERNLVPLTTFTQPLRYELKDGVIRILPRPDTSIWSGLYLDYWTSPDSFIVDTARAVVDTEALLQRATLLCKEHYGFPTGQARADHQTYLDKMRAMQSEGDGFQLGAQQSFKNAMTRRNRMAGTGAYRSNVAGDSWQPPGWW